MPNPFSWKNWNKICLNQNQTCHFHLVLTPKGHGNLVGHFDIVNDSKDGNPLWCIWTERNNDLVGHVHIVYITPKDHSDLVGHFAKNVTIISFRSCKNKTNHPISSNQTQFMTANVTLTLWCVTPKIMVTFYVTLTCLWPRRDNELFSNLI